MLLSSGHILMTGAPGLAKTTLVRVFAKYLSLNYGRVQFTPDLLPTDILGSDILNLDPETGSAVSTFLLAQYLSTFYLLMRLIGFSSNTVSITRGNAGAYLYSRWDESSASPTLHGICDSKPFESEEPFPYLKLSSIDS